MLLAIHPQGYVLVFTFTYSFSFCLNLVIILKIYYTLHDI